MRREITRYSNGKYYDRIFGRYVTVGEMAELVSRGEDLRVHDDRTGQADVTFETLLKILCHVVKEHYSGPRPIVDPFPSLVLRRAVRSTMDTKKRRRSCRSR